MQSLAVFQRSIGSATLLFAVAWSTAVLAGPPLVSDDTGILDPGGWEAIVSVTADKRGSADSYELPAFEVSYGLTNNSQMTVALSRAELKNSGERRKSDFGGSEIGYKYRFFEGEEIAWAISPAYSFPLNGSSSRRGIVDDVRVFALPVVGSWERGNWILTGQAAYEMASSGPNAWSYSLWTGFNATDTLQLLAEVYGVKVVGESVSETSWNLGVDYTLTDKWAVLLGYGGALRSDLARIDELDSSIYFGFRYVTGPFSRH